MSQGESPARPAIAADFVALTATDDRVTVQRADGPPSVVPSAHVSAVIEQNPEKRFVVEDAGALVGRLLGADGCKPQNPIWAALTDNRVIDVGLAGEAVRLAGRPVPVAPQDSLSEAGAGLWELMSRIAESDPRPTNRVEQFGPLGHGLRVRAAAVLGAVAARGVRLAPGAREDLIARCQERVESLEVGIRKVPQLGGILGRDRRRPDGLLAAAPRVSAWLADQVRRLRDVHGATVRPFLELTNDPLEYDRPEGWPPWALGLPAMPLVAAMMATARFWRDLISMGDEPAKPMWKLLPRFRVSAFDLDALPGVDAGRVLAFEEGTVPVRVSFHRLTAAAVAVAAAAEGQEGRLREILEAGDDPIGQAAESLRNRLPLGTTHRQRTDWAGALVRYSASGGALDGLKEYTEAWAGIDTDLSPGDYQGVRDELCGRLFPELGAWLTDCLIDWVEQSLPAPPEPGTLRRLVPAHGARARAVAEAFADPNATWGGKSEFGFYRLVVDHPEWELRRSLVENRGALANYQAHCTRPVVSPTGLVFPHLPWWANRANQWRAVFDEAALNVVARLATAGHRLAWVSERGIWLAVPASAASRVIPDIERLATEGVVDIVGKLCSLRCDFS